MMEKMRNKSDGAVTVEDEAIPRTVRGRRAHHARFGGPPPIVSRIDTTSSLYEIQAADRVRPDEPGTVVVVAFADSIFKYASSVMRNVSGMSVPDMAGAKKQQRLLEEMIENARGNENLTIDVRSAHELWESEGVMVVDVREPDAHRREHVPGAVNVPLHELPDCVSLLPQDKDATLFSICERGNLSLSGVLFLDSLGYRNARSINGGTQQWVADGFPTRSS